MEASVKRKLRWSWLWVLLTLGLAVAAVYFLMSSRSAPPVNPAVEESFVVDIAILEPGVHNPQITLLGEVRSNSLTTITSRITADVLETPVLAGAEIAENDILMRLDPVDAEVALSQRRADVAELQAQIAEEKLRHEFDQQSLKREQRLVELSEASLARQEKLIQSNLAARERLEVAETELEQRRLTVTGRRLTLENHRNRIAQLEARLQRAQAQLRVAEIDFAQTALRAPFAGWVTEVMPAPGSRVRVGDPLVQVLARGSTEVIAQVPDTEVGNLRRALGRGLQITAQTSVFQEEVNLTLTRLSARANDRTAGLNAFFSPVEPLHLTLGKTLTLNVTLPALDAVYSVPATALYGDSTLYEVKDERLGAREIDLLGRYHDAALGEQLIFRSQELAAGARVITTQLPRATSGLKVRPRISEQKQG